MKEFLAASAAVPMIHTMAGSEGRPMEHSHSILTSEISCRPDHVLLFIFLREKATNLES